MTKESNINYIEEGKINNNYILKRQEQLLKEVDFLAERKFNNKQPQINKSDF